MTTPFEKLKARLLANPEVKAEYDARAAELCADLDEGIRSLDAGKGQELDIERFLARKRSQHLKE